MTERLRDSETEGLSPLRSGGGLFLVPRQEANTACHVKVTCSLCLPPRLQLFLELNQGQVCHFPHGAKAKCDLAVVATAESGQLMGNQLCKV